MANRIFRGDAQIKREKKTVTVGGTYANGQVYTVTINGKDVTYTSVSGDDNTKVATALNTNLSGSTFPEFAECTWTVSALVITIEGPTDGAPITVTSSATGTGTLVTAAVSAGEGPNWWSLGENWVGDVIPQGACVAPTQSAAVAISGGSLANGTTYYWVVTATNGNGETTVSNERSLAIIAPNQTATISWAQVNGATGYKIYRSTVAGTYTTPALVTTITSGATLTFSDTGAALSAGAPPGSNTAVGDDVYIENRNVSIKYGIDQNTIALVTLNVLGNYTGEIGLPDWNAAGYYEYREKELKIRPGVLHVGHGEGNGPGFLRINTGTVASHTANIYKLGTPMQTGMPVLLLTGSHASNKLFAYAGRLGLAFNAGEVAQFNEINIGSIDSPATDVVLVGGTGLAALTTLNQNGGDVTVSSNVTTWTKTGGTARNLRSATITTIISDGPGTFNWDSDGIITTATFRGGSVLDNSRDERPKTLTNSTFISGGYFKDPFKKITFTNPWLTDPGSDALTVKGIGQYSLQRS